MASAARVLVPPALLLLAASVLLSGCASEAKVQPVARPAVVEQARSEQFAGLETYPGEVRARYESVLGFRVGGKIEKRVVDVGARVKQGDVLAVLEPQDANLAVSQARAQLAWSEADVSLAKAELERHAAMFEKKFISAALLDARRNQYDAAVARQTQAEAALAVAGNQADYTTLRADQDGVITAISAEAGQVVQAGQPVATLARDGEVEVLITVPEGRIAQFVPAQPVAIEIWARNNERHEGKVREVAPAADPRTRTYDVRVTLAQGEAKPGTDVQLGMTARVFLVDPNAQAALVLPLTALHEKQGAPAVWVYDPRTKQVALKPVRIGQYGEQGVNVLDGLTGQEWIVTAGVHKLVEGQVVRPIDRSNRALTL